MLNQKLHSLYSKYTKRAHLKMRNFKIGSILAGLIVVLIFAAIFVFVWSVSGVGYFYIGILITTCLGLLIAYVAMAMPNDGVRSSSAEQEMMTDRDEATKKLHEVIILLVDLQEIGVEFDLEQVSSIKDDAERLDDFLKNAGVR